MKLTKNEILKRCIDGEKWRCVEWPRGLCIKYSECKEAIVIGGHGESESYTKCWKALRNAEQYDWEPYIEKKPFPFKEGENAVCLIRCEHGDVWDLMPCDFLFDEEGISKCWTVVAEYNYKYFGSDEDIPGMIKASDLHLYDVEVEG